MVYIQIVSTLEPSCGRIHRCLCEFFLMSLILISPKETAWVSNWRFCPSLLVFQSFQTSRPWECHIVLTVFKGFTLWVHLTGWWLLVKVRKGVRMRTELIVFTCSGRLVFWSECVSLYGLRKRLYRIWEHRGREKLNVGQKLYPSADWVINIGSNRVYESGYSTTGLVFVSWFENRCSVALFFQFYEHRGNRKKNLRSICSRKEEALADAWRT